MHTCDALVTSMPISCVFGHFTFMDTSTGVFDMLRISTTVCIRLRNYNQKVEFMGVCWKKPVSLLAVLSILQVEKSPFVERLLKKGFEVLYLVEPIDEHTIQNLPDFDGKKFQNAAKVKSWFISICSKNG